MEREKNGKTKRFKDIKFTLLYVKFDFKQEDRKNEAEKYIKA